jgi:hypothetical protein
MNDWEGMNELEQSAWNQDVPYQATHNEPGRIFFGVARVVSKLLDASGYPDFELPLAGANNSLAVAAWWNRELDGALQPGMYDDQDPAFSYSGPWQILNHASAYDGRYHQQSGAGLASCVFYWCGSAIKVYFKRETGAGRLQVRSDPEYVNIDQAAGTGGGSPLWQQSATLSGLFGGLHFGIIRWHEFGMVNFDALEVIR